MTRKQLVYTLTAWMVWIITPVVSQEKIIWNPDSVINLPEVEINKKYLSRISNGNIKKIEVENELTTITGTTAEVLRNIPSLVTDMEGNMFFRGSTKSSILINGIPYGIMEENSGDVLIQLPALFFNNISLTSVPEMEYVPDGSSNTLSLSSIVPFNSPLLRFNLGVGLHERYNAGFLTNINSGKFHITAKYNYRKEFRSRTFKKSTTNPAGTTEMDNSAAARPDVHIADLSVAYNLSSKDIISVYGLYHRMDYDRYGGIHNTKLNTEGKVVNSMLRHRYNDQCQEATAVQAQWSHKFSPLKNTLAITFNYNNFAYDEDNHFENENVSTGKIVKQDNSFINQNKNQYYLSATYTKLFHSGMIFKGGYIGRLKNDKYISSTEDLIGETWVPNRAKSNNFSLNRIINMLYVSLHKDINRFGIGAGLQGEYTWQETKIDEIGRLTHHTYFHLYPQVKFSYKDLLGGNWLLSYSQRIDRPFVNDLNPFIDNSDATYIKQGNPHLKPEFVHLGELSYTYLYKTFRLVPVVYYRYRTQRIMDIATSDGSDIIWKKENIGNTQTAGIELAAYWFPLRFLSTGVAGNIFWDEIDGRAIGYNEKKSMSCWDIKGDIRLYITPATEFQIDGFYISDQLTPQGKIKSHYSVNAGISQYLMDRKLRINLSITNIFDSLKETTVIDSDKLFLHQERNRDARVVWLSLTYVL